MNGSPHLYKGYILIEHQHSSQQQLVMAVDFYKIPSDLTDFVMYLTTKLVETIEAAKAMIDSNELEEYL